MLVNCVAYQEGTKLSDISKEDISEYVKRPDCFVWVGLKDPTPGELEEMREEFGLHELAVEDARHGHQRPKIEEYGNSLFAVLQTVEFKELELHVGEVDIFVGPNYILSVRLHTERGFADVRARCEREPHLLKHGAAYVFYALMDAVVDRYFPILDSPRRQLLGDLGFVQADHAEVDLNCRGLHRCADHDRGHLRHELQEYARARVGVGISGVRRRDGGDRYLALFSVQEGQMALT
jgi:CorA-like Mg2+ transporter protein